MRKPGILIIERNDGWMLSGLPPSASQAVSLPAEPVDMAQTTIECAKESALDPGQLVLAVASETVLFAALDSHASASVRNNQSLRFALESVLPVDAESIVADAMRPRSKRSTGDLAAVCMDVSQIKSIVDALERLNCRVQFIVPSAILAIEQALSDNLIPAPSVTLWMLNQASAPPTVEMLVLASDGSCSNWRIFSLDQKSFEQNLAHFNPSELPVLLCGSQDELLAMASVAPINTNSLEIDRFGLIRKRSKAILSGQATPCVDLRRDDLASHDPLRRDRTAIARLTLAVGFLVATLCGTLLWQARVYESLAVQFNQKQLDLFRSAFPGQRAPAAILGRIKSEATKAKGIRKTDATSVSQKSALVTLQRVVANLTEEIPMEVREIKIENSRFSIEVELQSQIDAGKIAAALAREGFDVEPPSTTLVNGGHVLATINAAMDATSQPRPDDRGATL